MVGRFVFFPLWTSHFFPKFEPTFVENSTIFDQIMRQIFSGNINNFPEKILIHSLLIRIQKQPILEADWPIFFLFFSKRIKCELCAPILVYFHFVSFSFLVVVSRSKNKNRKSRNNDQTQPTTKTCESGMNDDDVTFQRITIGQFSNSRRQK